VFFLQINISFARGLSKSAILHIDDVAIIRAINDSKEATRELVYGKPGTLVYHTANEKIEVLIRKRVGFRGVM